jgi:hypothetical protein
MATDSAAKLRLLAAEIRAEQDRIDRTVSELDAAVTAVGQLDSTRLQLYGAAALLETFYSGVEKALTRPRFPRGEQDRGRRGKGVRTLF